MGAKRGLEHATIDDKRCPVGRNDDDEYDFDGAQIVNSDFTAEELEVFKRRKAAKPEVTKPAEDEDEKGPMKFRGKKERKDGKEESGRSGVATGRKSVDISSRSDAGPAKKQKIKLNFED